MMMPTTVKRLQGYLTNLAREFPGVWKQVDDFRAAKGALLAPWPAWCFLPMAAAVAIVTKGEDIESIQAKIKTIVESTKDDKERADRFAELGYSHISVLGALAAWRVSQGIYVFDPDLFESVVDTPFEKLPSEVFYHLPEWCVYVEIPEAFQDRYGIRGFFVHLEYDPNSQKTELRFLTDRTEDDLMAYILELGKPTVTEAIDAIVVTKTFLDNPKEMTERLTNVVQPLIALTTYICSVNADVRHLTDKDKRPVRPRPVKTKKGLRLFPPDRVSEWRVGFRIGAALRKARAQAEQETSERRTSSAPHVRRAHWHSFWTGKRSEETPGENLVVKWLPPIPVGFADAVVPTVHKVSL